MEKAAGLFGANDNRYGALLTTFLCMDLPGAHQVHVAGVHTKLIGQADLGIIGPGTVVEPLVAFDGLTTVKNAVEGPIVGVVVNLGAAMEDLDQSVDDKAEIGVLVEEKIPRTIPWLAIRSVLGTFTHARIEQQLAQVDFELLPVFY